MFSQTKIDSRTERLQDPGGRMLRVPHVLLAAIGLVLTSRSAFAYIDPGTTQAVWSSLAPVVGIVVTCLAALLIPLRFFWGRGRVLWKKLPKVVRIVLATGCVIVLIAGITGFAMMFADKGKTSGHSVNKVKEVNYKRVMVLGIDGLDPNRLEQMMNAGKLPNFARLRKTGTFTRLRTSIPPESPVAWLCASTGVNPGRHGIFDFIGRNPKNYLPELAILKSNPKGPLSLSSQPYIPATHARTFWDVLSDQGIKTCVIRWPVTFPPQPTKGRLFTGLGTPDVIGTLGQYKFYTTIPLAPDDKAADRMVRVAWSSNIVETTLSGPQITSLTGVKTSTIPLRLERVNKNKSIKISLGKSEAISLREGEWSKWIPVEFPGGLSRKCPAMVRLYVASVEPDLGLYVSPLNIDPMNPAFQITHPAGFSKELAEEIGRFTTLGLPEDTQAARHGRIPLKAFLEQCDHITTERELMLERELKQFDSGLLAVVFDTSDRIQHMFWAASDPSHPSYTPELAQKFGNVIEDHYRRMDTVLGKTIQAIGDDTPIFVLSDHGFTSFKRAAHLNTWLIRNGFMTLKDANDSEGAPLLRSVDWYKTKAYAVGFCSLYLNMRGREGKGIVAEGQERRQLTEELSRALKAWCDPKNGETVVRNVYVADEVFQGKHLAQAPELILGYYPGYRASWQTALGAAPAGEPVVDNDDIWSGDHLVDPASVPGIFLSNIKCTVHNPRLIDIAPTVLRAFNAHEHADMDGRPLF